MPGIDKPEAFDVDPEEWRKQFWDDDAGGKADTKAKGNGSDAAASGSAVPDFPVMAEEALHGPAGEIVRTIAPHTESDPALLLIGSLVYFGNALGHGPHHVVEGTPHYPNLYALFVGDTSKARKGTGDGRVRQIFKLAAPAWCGYRIKSGLSSGEGLINEVRDPVVKMVKGEEQTVDEGVDDKRLLIVQSEFGGALQALKREGSLLSTVMRDGWDGRDLATLVKHSPLRATNPLNYWPHHQKRVGLPHGPDLDGQRARQSVSIRLCAAIEVLAVRRKPVAARCNQTRLGSGFRHRARQSDRRGAMAPRRGRRMEEHLRRALGGQARASRTPIRARRGSDHSAGVGLCALGWLLLDRAGPSHRRYGRAELLRGERPLRLRREDRQFGRDTILAALTNAYPEGLTRTEIRDLFARNAEAGAVATALQELQSLGRVMMSRRVNGRGRPVEIWTLTRPRGN